MRLDGRRESSNVEDRRKSGTKKAGVSIGSLLLVGVIAYFTSGGDWGKVAKEVVNKNNPNK
jgi:predicted metalloprotease